MVQKLSYTANSITLGTGTSKVVLGADSGNLIVKDSQSNTSIIEPGLGVQGGAAVTTYANSSVLPFSPISPAGSLAYATLTGTLYLSNGSGWYKVSLVNTAPSITLSSTTASPTLDGLTLDFTYTVAEPEGTPVNVTLANSGIATTGNVAITHTTSNNHIRLVFDGTTEYDGDATVTLTVTDGVNTGTGTITIDTNYISAINSSARAGTLLVGNYVANQVTNWDRDVKDDGSDPWTSSETKFGNFTYTAAQDNSINRNRPKYGIMRVATSPYQPKGTCYNFSTYYRGRIMVRNKDTTSLVMPQAGSWTLEGWAEIMQFGQSGSNYSTPSVAWNAICATENYDSSGGGMALVFNATSKKIDLRVSTGTSDSVLIAGSNKITRTNVTNNYSGYPMGTTTTGWVHWAIVNNSGTITLYTNGRSEGSASQPYDFNTTTGDLMIGCSKYYAVGSGSTDMCILPGYVADIRLDKSAVYTSEFAPPKTHLEPLTNTKFHLSSGLNRLTDRSTIKHRVEAWSTADWANHLLGVAEQDGGPYDHVAYDPAVHGGSYFVNGNNSESIINFYQGDSPVFDGDFSVSFWYKPMNINGLGDYGHYCSLGNNGTELSIGTYKQSSTLWYRTYINGTVRNEHNTGFDNGSTESGGKQNLSGWQYVVMQRSSGTVTWHVNGDLLRSATVTDTLAVDTLRWGSSANSQSSNYLNDMLYLSDLYILKGSVLASTDPPTELRTTGSAIHHLKCNDIAYYNTGTGDIDVYYNPDYAMKYNGTGAGLIQTVNDSPPGYNLHSIDFPGSGNGGQENYAGGLRMKGPQNFRFMTDAWGGEAEKKGAFTAAFWFKAGDVSGQQTLYYNGTTGNDIQDCAVEVYLNSSTLICRVWRENNQIDGTISKSSISADTWYYVSVTFSNLGAVTMHVDGVLQGRFNQTRTLAGNRSFPIRNNYVFLGSRANNSTSSMTQEYHGQLTDVFQICQAYYPQNIVPTATSKSNSQSHETTTASNTKLIAASGGTVTTEGTGDGTHTISAIGSPTVSSFGPQRAPAGWKSLYFDGTNDGLSVSAHADWQMGSSDDFCIEFWYWAEDWQSSGHTTFFNVGNGFGSADFKIYRNSDQTIKLWNGTANVLQTNTGTMDLIDSDWPSVYAWNHIALTRKSGKVLLWYNGSPSQVGDITGNTDVLNGGTGNVLYIGQAINGTQRFKGYLSQFRWVKGDCVYEENYTKPSKSLFS